MLVLTGGFSEHIISQIRISLTGCTVFSLIHILRTLFSVTLPSVLQPQMEITWKLVLQPSPMVSLIPFLRSLNYEPILHEPNSVLFEI